MKFSILVKNILLLSLLGIIQSSQLKAQQVSLSPSRLYYNVEAGEYKSQFLNITNNSNMKQSFTISFADFEPQGYLGKSQMMEEGQSENSCSKWLSATPSYFEVEPGQTQKVQILLQVPSSPEANKVKWAAIKIKLTKEKSEAGSGDKNAIGLGVTETFQFIVHIFQSPPSVTFKNAEITSFKEIADPKEPGKVFALHVKNTGEAILNCASYLEYTNLNNGNEDRLKPIAFTILPGAEREVKFNLNVDLEKGKYSVLGVVDYGSTENVQAAELQIEIQ